MPRLIWAIPCRTVLTDADTNSVSYIEAVEEIGLPHFPYACPSFYIGTFWERPEKQELAIRVRLLGPNNEKVGGFESPPIAHKALRHRLNLAFGGPGIKQPGKYTLALDWKSGDRWKNTARLPLSFKHLEPETPSDLDNDNEDVIE